jgi:hypothetical protein
MVADSRKEVMKMKNGKCLLGVISAVLAFMFCFGAGLWILTATGLDHENDVLATGIGLYFIGKAFFVGPALLLMAKNRDE